MTSMLHRFAGDDDFQMRLQLSQLRYTTSLGGPGHRAGRELRRDAVQGFVVDSVNVTVLA